MACRAGLQRSLPQLAPNPWRLPCWQLAAMRLLSRAFGSAAGQEGEEQQQDERGGAGRVGSSRMRASVVPFALSPSEALDAFRAFQRAACFNLHAGNLLSAGHSLEAAFLPFYLFEATITTEAIATLGRRADRSSKTSPMVWREMDDWVTTQSRLELPCTDPCMQVYASYRLRRDLAEAAKAPAAVLEAAAPMMQVALDAGELADPVGGGAARRQMAAEGSSRASSSRVSSSRAGSSRAGSSRAGSSRAGSEAASAAAAGGSAGAVPLDPPDMRQAIAWQLCHRQIMHAQAAAAAEHLKGQHSADDVKNLQLRLAVHRRAARLAFLPAYHLRYVHGEKYTPSRADIVAAEYEAVVGGGLRPRVCAELHPSRAKSQAAAAAAVGGVGFGVMPLTGFALGLDPGLLGLAGADAALLAVLAAAGAGALAGRLPLIARNAHVAEQVEADRRFYRQYDQRETAPGAPPDEHTLWLWRDADWRRWEQEDRWTWDGAKRQRWAEDLFRQQAQREVDRAAAARQREEASKQRAEEEQREAEREHLYGRSRRFMGGAAHHAHEESGARPAHGGGRPGQPRRRRDFLGYYKALGISLEDAGAGPVTAELIKVHYKAAALKLHPDRHAHADEAAQRRAAERFRRLQLAYETLRDAERRRAYDQGRHPAWPPPPRARRPLLPYCVQGVFALAASAV